MSETSHMAAETAIMSTATSFTPATTQQCTPVNMQQQAPATTSGTYECSTCYYATTCTSKPRTGFSAIQLLTTSLTGNALSNSPQLKVTTLK